MSFSGDGSHYPASFELFDDALPPTAANINVSPTALGHRTAFLKRWHDALILGVALNFHESSFGHERLDLVKQRNDANGRRVFYCSSSYTFDVLQKTSRYQAWPDGETASSLITSGKRIGVAIGDFDVDDSGNIVCVDVGFDGIRTYDAGANAWDTQSVSGSFDPVQSSIVWSRAAGTWVVAYSDNGGGPASGPAIFTSANRTLWTSRSLPSGVPTATTVRVTLAANDAGSVLVSQWFAGSNVYFSRSTDGGISWSAAQSFALGFTAATSWFYWPRPVWTGTHWIAVASNGGTASGSAKVFRSADGETWEEVSSLSSPLRYVAALGPVLLGLVGDDDAAFSLDEGETWRRLDTRFSDVPATVTACDGRFVVAGMGVLTASMALARDAFALLT